MKIKKRSRYYTMGAVLEIVTISVVIGAFIIYAFIWYFGLTGTP